MVPGTVTRMVSAAPGMVPGTVTRLVYVGPISRSSLLRDLLHDLAGALGVGVARDVGLREDPDEPAVLFDDGQAPHLVRRHQAERFVELLLRVDRDEVGGSDLVDRRRLRVAPFGDHLDRDVAVCDDPDEALAVDDRRDARVLVAHQPGGVDDAAAGGDRARVLCHELSDLHARVLSAGDGAQTTPRRPEQLVPGAPRRQAPGCGLALSGGCLAALAA